MAYHKLLSLWLSPIIALTLISFPECQGGGYPLDVMPLVFSPTKADPSQVRVYFHPLINISLVTSLRKRDIHYSEPTEPNPNTNVEIRETSTDWQTLVRASEADDGTKRYISLRNRPCDESDWEVTWMDNNNVKHGPILQRLPPADTKWMSKSTKSGIKLKLDQSKAVYDDQTDTITVPLQADFDPSGMSDFDDGSVVPMQQLPSVLVTLTHCDFVFTEPQKSPYINPEGDMVIVPGEYARKRCTITVDGTVLVYNRTASCRQSLRTAAPLSQSVTLLCGNALQLPCTDYSARCQSHTLANGRCNVECHAKGSGIGRRSQPQCSNGISCRPFLHAQPKWITLQELSGFSEAVEVNWRPSQADRPPVGHMVRLAEVDRSHENYPIKEFNITRLTLPPNQTSVTLLPYSSTEGAAYSIQVCTVYKEECLSTPGMKPNWDAAPKRAIYFNELLADIGAKPVTTTSTVIVTAASTTTTDKPTTEIVIVTEDLSGHLTKMAEITEPGIRTTQSILRYSTTQKITRRPWTTSIKQQLTTSSQVPSVEKITDNKSHNPPEEHTASYSSKIISNLFCTYLSFFVGFCLVYAFSIIR